jgi:hypothetical protein
MALNVDEQSRHLKQIGSKSLDPISMLEVAASTKHIISPLYSLVTILLRLYIISKKIKI